MDQLSSTSDTQVGVIGVLAGPAGLRATGWRLDARGASIEPDETVQQTIGQLEYFAGQRRRFDLTLDLLPLPSSTEAVLRALMTVEYGKPSPTVSWPSGAVRAFRQGDRLDHGRQSGTHRDPVSPGRGQRWAGRVLRRGAGPQPGDQTLALENEGALPPALI